MWCHQRPMSKEKTNHYAWKYEPLLSLFSPFHVWQWLYNTQSQGICRPNVFLVESNSGLLWKVFMVLNDWSINFRSIDKYSSQSAIQSMNDAHQEEFTCDFFLWFGTVVYRYSSGLLHWHWGNHMIVPVPVKQLWRIWVNTSHEPTENNTA